MHSAARITELSNDDLARLSARITALESDQRAREEQIQLLKEENAWLRARLWGRSSEKSVIEQISPDQWRLVFNEAEARASEPAAIQPRTIEIAAHARKGQGRRKLPAHLERHPVIYDLPDSDKVCPHDGTTLTVMDRETSEHYHFERARAWITEEVRLKYSCPCCRQHVRLAPAPVKLLPKSIASPELLAHITTTKFVDAVPLNRQVKQLARYDIPISVATLSNWMLTIGGDRLVPLINLMTEQLLDAPVMHSDETTLQVLQSEKSPTSDHYMWVRLGVLPATEREAERRIVLFTYTPYRNTETLQRLFEGFSGKLVSDALELYGTYADQKSLIHGLCLAHARRGFEEARKIAEGQTKAKQADAALPNSVATRARVALDYFRDVYRIEREIADFSPADKLAVRKARSAPIMTAFKGWLDDLQPKVWPEGKLGKAINYCLNHWEKLCTFLHHGDVPVDNNPSERAIRPFVIGRNNWVLHKSQAGATASANLYSIVETCRTNGVEPYAYLCHLYTQLPNARSVEDFEALLPWNAKHARARAPPD